MRNEPDTEARFLNSRQVCRRYNISGTTFRRWRHDPVLGFPKPYSYAKSMLWLVSELDAFDSTRPHAVAA